MTLASAGRRYLFYAEQNYAFAILRPLQEQIRARGDEVAWFLVGEAIDPAYLEPDETRLDRVQDVVDYSPAAVFVPGNVVPGFIPGVKVGVFHGFNTGKKNRRGKLDHFNIRGCFDLYCTQGPSTTGRFKKLEKKHGHFRVEETGWPALDPLFAPREQVEDVVVRRPTVLLCSTFSRNLTCAPHLHDTVRRLREDDRWRWLVQFHPKMDEDIVESYKSLGNDNLTFVETDNVIPLLRQADVMVCDTSSMIQMFLVQGKPVVAFRNREGGDHLYHITRPEELAPAIGHALSQPADLMKAIHEYRRHIHPYTDGMSSRRVLAAADALAAEGRAALKRKPLNLVRKFKMWRKLRYYGNPKHG